MKIYAAIIFFILGLNAKAQVIDDFTDGDFTNSPTWSGIVSDFNVNAAAQLQLHAISAGNSYLSVPANINSLDSCEWHFLKGTTTTQKRCFPPFC